MSWSTARGWCRPGTRLATRAELFALFRRGGLPTDAPTWSGEIVQYGDAEHAWAHVGERNSVYHGYGHRAYALCLRRPVEEAVSATAGWYHTQPTFPDLVSYLAPDDSFFLGATEPDVRIYAFLDLACPISAEQWSNLIKLVAEDPGVQVVVKSMPLRKHEPGASMAHRAAIAAGLDGRFEDVATRLFAAQTLDAAGLAALIASWGYAPEAMAPARAADVERRLAAERGMAERVRVPGVPNLFVERRHLGGLRGVDELRGEITAARAGHPDGQP